MGDNRRAFIQTADIVGHIAARDRVACLAERLIAAGMIGIHFCVENVVNGLIAH